MDLSLIQTHLDNFVDTWTGWGKVLHGLVAFDGFVNLFKVSEATGEGTLAALSSLSSK